MALAGFYRRSLPSPPAIDFSSPQGRELFNEALHNGNMEGFFKLISYFQTQSEPAYCGLATLAMVLNALAIDPCRTWKGPWRWFDETMLDCCEPLEKIKDRGISFGKVVCLAHCAGAKVEAFRADQSSVHEFRKYVITCSKSDDCHVISSYDRRTFKQTGMGHFSPIGGYHAESDMVLILDVARFKYPPHWVPLSLLWEAMDTIVGSSGLRRGFMVLSRRQRELALLHPLCCKHESWISTAKYLTDDIPVLLSSYNVKSVKVIIQTISSSLPPEFSDFTKWVMETHKKEDNHPVLNQEEKQRPSVKEEVLKLVQETDLYKHVEDAFAGMVPPCCDTNTDIPPAGNDVFTALLLALPSQTWSAIKDAEVAEEMSCLVSIKSLPPLLQDEILHLRDQLLLPKRCKGSRREDDLNVSLI